MYLRNYVINYKQLIMSIGKNMQKQQDSARQDLKRLGEFSRKTKETDISVKCNIDGIGNANINTGIGFLITC